MTALRSSMLPCIENPAVSAMAHDEWSIAYGCDRLADEIEQGRELARWSGRSIVVGDRELMLDDELVLILLSQQLELGYIGIAADCSPFRPELDVEPLDLRVPQVSKVRDWCADHVLHVALGCAVLALLLR